MYRICVIQQIIGFSIVTRCRVTTNYMYSVYTTSGGFVRSGFTSRGLLHFHAFYLYGLYLLVTIVKKLQKLVNMLLFILSKQMVRSPLELTIAHSKFVILNSQERVIWGLCSKRQGRGLRDLRNLLKVMKFTQLFWDASFEMIALFIRVVFYSPGALPSNIPS